jgi:hypothetical protein
MDRWCRRLRCPTVAALSGIGVAALHSKVAVQLVDEIETTAGVISKLEECDADSPVGIQENRSQDVEWCSLAYNYRG